MKKNLPQEKPIESQYAKWLQQLHKYIDINIKNDRTINRLMTTSAKDKAIEQCSLPSTKMSLSNSLPLIRVKYPYIQ